MTAELKDFRIQCLKCQATNVIVETESTIDYGGYTGVQSGSVVIKCLICGNAQTFYT